MSDTKRITIEDLYERFWKTHEIKGSVPFDTMLSLFIADRLNEIVRQMDPISLEYKKTAFSRLRNAVTANQTKGKA